MRVIPGAIVERLLPIEQCIELMATVLGALARGEATQPVRTQVQHPTGDGTLYVMPAWTADPAAIAVKMVTLFPANRALGRETHQGVVVLFDAANGEPLALIDAAAITAIRTAAVSALATRLLAREDAGDVAILGSGVQARSHLRALSSVRQVRRVRAWSPTPERLRGFVADAATFVTAPVEASASARDAVDGADIVCLTTSAREPVVYGDWLAPGTHVNAIGASTPDSRELDSAAVARSAFFVDSRAAVHAESGDFLIAVHEGIVEKDHIRGELGEVVIGAVAGRRTRDEITVFKSLGLAVEDVAAAHHVHAAAAGTDAGTLVSLGEMPAKEAG